MMRLTFAAVLLAFLALPLFADDPIKVTAQDVSGLDINGNLDFRFTVKNNAPGVPSDVTALMTFPPGMVFVNAPGADCTLAVNGLRCTLPSIASHGVIVFDVFLKPPAYRGRFLTTMAVTARFGNVSYTVSVNSTALLSAPFVVTSTADDGPGSLRQAITDANRECGTGVPCRISFAIQEPLPERGWYTIQPLSALPAIDASDIAVDARFLNEVPIELRGTYVYGDGLVFHGTATLNGLSIDGFFDNGVVIDQKIPNGLLISNNVIGSDPSGAPVPNGLRGIAVVSGSGTIRDNVINGNSRSGIFITSQDSLKILANRITNNGASGIYIGPPKPDSGFMSQFNVQGNVISGNHDFPIGIDVSATRVAVRDNAMFDNGAPFDIGMDGPGVRMPPAFNRIEPTPAVTSAVYDAASGDTVVTIDVNPFYVNFDTDTVYVFANHGLDRAGRAEAETFLGTVSIQRTATSPKQATVVFRTHADLRGQIITALTLRSSPFDFDTQEVSSELSEGVVVR